MGSARKMIRFFSWHNLFCKHITLLLGQLDSLYPGNWGIVWKVQSLNLGFIGHQHQICAIWIKQGIRKTYPGFEESWFTSTVISHINGMFFENMQQSEIFLNKNEQKATEKLVFQIWEEGKNWARVTCRHNQGGSFLIPHFRWKYACHLTKQFTRKNICFDFLFVNKQSTLFFVWPGIQHVCDRRLWRRSWQVGFWNCA